MGRALYFVAAAALVLASGALLFHRLGAADVCTGDEAVEAVFLQQMVEHGEVLFPLENGQTPMYKPPLFHWTGLALDKLAGVRTVTAGNLRAISALYALAGIVLTMVLGYALLGAEGSLLAGLTLAASYQYIELGRYGRVDMTLAFFETLALALFVWWIPPTREESASSIGGGPARRWLLYLFALAMGLAVLAKGPVGALLPGAAIVAFLLIERRYGQLLALLEPGPIIFGALVAISWYVACYLNGKTGFLHRQLGAENLGRFFGQLGAMAPWYYVKPLLLNSAPLSLFAPIAVALIGWKWYAGKTDEPSGTEAPRATSALRLFAIFYVVTVVFFSIASYKRRSYLLPLWPANAMMIAWLVLSVSRTGRATAIKWAYAVLCVGLMAFNFLYIPEREIRACADSTYRPAAEEIRTAVGDSPLYTYGFDEEIAPLLFYLDRDAPRISGRLGDAPPGYVIVPEKVWREQKSEALDLESVLTSEHGQRNVVLLHHGKAMAFEFSGSVAHTGSSSPDGR